MMTEEWAETLAILVIHEMIVDQITVVHNVIHQVESKMSTIEIEEAIRERSIAQKKGVIDVETLENDLIKKE